MEKKEYCIMNSDQPRIRFLRATLSASALAMAIAFALAIVATTPAAQAQTFNVIHNFTGSDGANPFAGLTMDRAGNLYGTTFRGGSGPCNIYGLSGCGTAYKLTHKGSGWTYNMLHSFMRTDGTSPYARVIFGPDGSLYGTTSEGGGVGGGTVFN